MQNNRKLKIAVLVSGGGTNLQSLIDASLEGYFNSEITLVLSNKSDAYGLERASKAKIPNFVIKNDDEILDFLEKYSIDLVVLAGYLKILGKDFLEKYKNKIINIHPSLLPKFGGKGMYGLNVHKSVYHAGEKESGATVHYVTEEVDGGQIILQKAIDISSCKSPEEIQENILKIEHEILKEAVKNLEEEEF